MAYRLMLDLSAWQTRLVLARLNPAEIGLDLLFLRNRDDTRPVADKALR